MEHLTLEKLFYMKKKKKKKLLLSLGIIRYFRGPHLAPSEAWT